MILRLGLERTLGNQTMKIPSTEDPGRSAARLDESRWDKGTRLVGVRANRIWGSILVDDQCISMPRLC